MNYLAQLDYLKNFHSSLAQEVKHITRNYDSLYLRKINLEHLLNYRRMIEIVFRNLIEYIDGAIDKAEKHIAYIENAEALGGS